MRNKLRIRLAGRLSVAMASALCLLPAATRANDTTLNVNVNPPRQLAQFELPIRMAAEHITVHFGRERSRVTVEFTFENLSDDELYCEAGFPDEDLLARWANYAGADAEGRVPADRFPSLNSRGDNAARSLDDTSVLTDFESWSRPAGAAPSANAPLATKLLRIERIAYEPEALASLGGSWQPSEFSAANELMFCRSFTLELGPREKIIIGHSYSTENGSNVESQRLFNYTLGTGRSWAGTIGQATLEVYLEDGLSVDDLHFRTGPDDYGALSNPGREQWKQISATHLRAFWQDFEPRGARAYIMLATHPVPMPVQ